MKTVSLGIEDFGRMRASNYFYIDKTAFIREWWENGALVTVLTRPRRLLEDTTFDPFSDTSKLTHRH